MHHGLLSRVSLLALGVAGGLFGTACAGTPDGAPLGLRRTGIVNGVRADSSSDAVVNVISHPPGSDPTTCTGTLIAPNLVITALHCVANYGGGSFTCNADGTITQNTPSDGAIGELSSPDQIWIGTGVFPTYNMPDAVGTQVFGTGSTQICRNDLALVVLDKNLDMPIAAIRLNGPVTLGEHVRVDGYGQTETSGTSGRFERTGLTVIDVGPDAIGTVNGRAAPRTFVVDEGPCLGDSGGPAFSEDTGAILGVYSLKAAATCTSLGIRNVYTHLSPFSSLIEQAFQAAGADPVLEPVDAGVDAGSDAGDDSGVSAGGASGAGGGSGGSAGAVRPGGSGSRSDPSCSCRTAGAAGARGSGALAGLLALALLGRRRRARGRASL